MLNKKPNEDSGTAAGDYKTGEHDQSLHGQSALLRMIGQMVMAMLWRIPNNRRLMMRFMLIDRYENGVAVIVRAPGRAWALVAMASAIPVQQHPER